MKEPGIFKSDDEHLAMKMQIEEGLSMANANTTDGDSIATGTNVARLPLSFENQNPNTSRAGRQQQRNGNGGDGDGDGDGDYELAWDLQVQENDEAVERDMAIVSSNENHEASDVVAEETMPLANLRMGAAPYEARIRDRLGNSSYARARENAVLVDFPPSLGLEQQISSSLTSSSNLLTSPDSSISRPTASTDTATVSTRHIVAKKMWYDASRPGDGDPVFLHLLGHYPGDPDAATMGPKKKLCLKIPANEIPNLTSQKDRRRKLSEAVVGASVVIVKDDKARVNKPQTTIDDIIQQTVNLEISFREAAIHLPFSVRFQLERCMLGEHAWDDSSIAIRKRDAPKTPRQCLNRKEAISLAGRKMILVFLQEVLPCLLLTTERLKDSLTLQELFAEEIYELLKGVKMDIKGEGERGYLSFETEIEKAMMRAEKTLAGAKTLCQCPNGEADLLEVGDEDSEAYTQLIRRRSLWPMAEYRVRFTQDGRLLPKGYEVVNRANANKAINENEWTMKHALKYAKGETRRVLREVGWSVRDRFAAFSDVKFTDIYTNHLKSWCLQRPMVCGRRYEFLHDKGTGDLMLWFFAPATEMSREQLLLQLGDFSCVDATKLGDRVGLSFTPTKPLMHMAIDKIIAIPEIVHNGYRFSDGCGVMGWNVAKRIAEIDPGNGIQGAIQIRIGGVKGMLRLKTDFPPDSIGIRPSMCKFPSKHRLLEVKRVAKMNMSGDKSLFSMALLILSANGVPTEVFLDLQRRHWVSLAVQHDRDAEMLLKKPVDYQKISSYFQRVTEQGRKLGGTKFAFHELNTIRLKMEQKRNKVTVNFPCSVALMLGVVDEHNILEPDEVLIGNGAITGWVLICRTPCMSPGDIQKVKAIPRKDDTIHEAKALRGSLVFSAKGERPLPDKLAGGDLDGDEFYVIFEPQLVEHFTSVEACDFGSQNPSFQDKILVSIEEYFSVSQHVIPPALGDQLDVLEKFFRMGNVVTASADAWTRCADRFDVADLRAMKLASIHQQALDARKLACEFSPTDFKEMDKILSEINKPKWNGGPDENPADSILGALDAKLEGKIKQITATAERRRVQEQLAGGDEESVVSETTQNTQNTRQYDSEFHPSLSSKTGTEILIDVTFDREKVFSGSDITIDYSRIDETGRKALINMVLIEYDASIQDGLKKATRMEYANDWPREYEVFLIKTGFSQAHLAICQPIYRGSDGDVEWRISHGTIPIDEVDYKCRIGSLSSFSRILDSLICNPVPLLMRKAMNREGFCDAVDPASISLPPDDALFSSLNHSQKKAVATVLNDSFRSKAGFFAIQGPPGTGKTRTIVAMVSATHRLHPHEAMLLVAPSNAAVANIARRLVATRDFGSSNVVVWGEKCDASVSFLNPRHRHERFMDYHRTSDEDEKKFKLAQIASWLQLDNAEAVSESDIKALCGDKDGGRNVASASAVLCTLNTAGSRSLRKAIRDSKTKFELAILDEGSQCPEAEFYIITTLAKRIVLVGDPQQLGPTVLSDVCEVRGYGESFLGNILKNPRTTSKVHLLDTQYRMDPSKLLEFVNKTFYKGRLVSDESVKNRQPHVANPFLFLSTSKEGYGTEERDGFSYFNNYEAGAIKYLLQNDKDIQNILAQAAKDAKEPPRIIVITPYKAQADRLRRILKKTKGLEECDVSTVDSFQGQEGEIVLISTVRTDSVGFSDNANRLCVALTRARRVLRVVGHSDFFKGIANNDSILRKLTIFAEKEKLINEADIDDVAAWRRPRWRPEDTSWKATMVARFHHCLKAMERRDRNVAFNTLLALATPEIKRLQKRIKESESARWHISGLHNQDNAYVTWLAKPYQSDGGRQYTGIIEAHFAGKEHECRQFVQKHRLVQAHSAVGVTFDLRAIKGINVSSPTEDVQVHSSEIDVRSFTVSSGLQGQIIDGTLGSDIPEGLLNLDDQQELILTLKPPLLLESRSGTGKTNVLMRHALCYLQEYVSNTEESSDVKILFVTVSAPLCRELRERYERIVDSSQLPLPPIAFLSFRDLLQRLLDWNNDDEVTVSSACTYLHYCYDRKSHQKMLVEPSLVENEVGGVILGSLNAARKGAPLDEEEYLEEKRSNIPANTVEGKKKRKQVFQYFLAYQKWKKANGNKYDLADLVLRLIRIGTKRNESFVSVYLDEVQDFSYAAIFLICSIAGSSNEQWVAAGDTAQMISIGCSFRFDGLKETLLAIKPGVSLRKAVQLKRNYRMTKSVLKVANAILALLKEHFPSQIEYCTPEVSMKDLGLKVHLVTWKEALGIDASLGTTQAIVYSAPGDAEDELKEEMDKWTSGHPFTMNVLDAKGLEFDDVIVVFDKSNAAWDVSKKSVEALRNLRELYVAVTRAKKRVVVLTKGKIVKNFFQQLACGHELELTDAGVALLDFNRETSVEDWFEAGMARFQNENFNFAESCFIRADNFGWANRAQGKQYMKTGRPELAKESFRLSAKSFHESNEFEHCLDVLKDMADIPDLDWDPQDNAVLDDALQERPDHLSRQWTVRFSIFRGDWKLITARDLHDKSLQSIFSRHRDDRMLQDKISDLAKDAKGELDKVSHTLPALVGDYYLAQRRFVAALALFLVANDESSAIKATEKAITEARGAEGNITQVVKLWEDNPSKKTLKNTKINDLLDLFRDPSKVAETKAAKCLQQFGHHTVRLAVQNSSNTDELLLHSFDPNRFQDEVEAALIKRYNHEPIQILRFYSERKDRSRALTFAVRKLQSWSDKDLVHYIFGKLTFQSEPIVDEIHRRGILLEAIQICLDPTGSSRDVGTAERLSNISLESTRGITPPLLADELVRVWEPSSKHERVVRGRKRTGEASLGFPIYLLLSLFTEPEATGRKSGKQCMAMFGRDIVRSAVSRSSSSDPREIYRVLCLFDETVFEADKPKPKPKPPPQPKSKGTGTGTGAGGLMLKKGDRVETIGMRQPRHNGKRGKVTKVNAAQKKSNVLFDTGEASTVKLENLIKITSDEGTTPQDNPKPPPVASRSRNDKDSSSAGSESEAEIPNLISRPMMDSSSDEERGMSRKKATRQPPISRDEIPPARSTANRNLHHVPASTDFGFDSSDSNSPDRVMPSSSSGSDDSDDSDGVPPLMGRQESSGNSSSDSPGDDGRGFRPIYSESESDVEDGVPPPLASRGALVNSSDDDSSDGVADATDRNSAQSRRRRQPREGTVGAPQPAAPSAQSASSTQQRRNRKKTANKKAGGRKKK